MMSAQPAGHTFHEGDEVVLAKGSYQGTLGVFLRLKKDTSWADIRERNGAHPQPSSDAASSFRDHDPSFHKLTPP